MPAGVRKSARLAGQRSVKDVAAKAPVETAATSSEAAHLSRWTKIWEDTHAKGKSPGFHRPTVHETLKANINRLICGKLGPERIYVPLCGKSNDMVYLQKFGEVAGVEISQRAIDEFGQEQQMAADKEVLSKSDGRVFKFTSSSDKSAQNDQEAINSVTIGKYDIFKLPENWSQLTTVTSASSRGIFTAAFDRAAFIAIEPMYRQAYAEMMAEQLSVGAKMLLLTLDYDSELSSGPPFCADKRVVQQIFEPAGFQVEEISARDIIDQAGQESWKAGGHSFLTEFVFLLTRLATTGTSAMTI